MANPAVYGIGARLGLPYTSGSIQGVIVSCKGDVTGYVYTLRFLQADGSCAENVVSEPVLVEHNPPPVDVAALNKQIKSLEKRLANARGVAAAANKRK